MKNQKQEVIKNVYNYIEKNKINDDMIITTGVGNHQMMSAQFYRWSRPKSIITSDLLELWGVGLPLLLDHNLQIQIKLLLFLMEMVHLI